MAKAKRKAARPSKNKQKPGPRALSRADSIKTIEALESAIAAGHPYEHAGGRTGVTGARRIAAAALRISYESINSRIHSMRRNYPDLAKRIAEFASPPASLHDGVRLKRAHVAGAAARAQLSAAQQEINRLQDRLKELEWAAHADAAPASWTFSGRIARSGEHIPYLLTSDFQIGEVIRKEETDATHGYDTATFRRRYRKLIEATISLCKEHTGSAWKFPGIIYARGGDTISGGIHDELAETDDVSPIEAVEIAFEEESAGIYKLLEAFGRVDVKDAGGGNHDRSTHKPRSKGANAHSYDRLVSFMLRREFRANKRVHFQATESPDVLFPIYDVNVLLTHGDKIGSRGGMGYIGPVATIARGAQKVIMEQQALGRRVDRVDVGHFHSPFFGDWFLANGCMPGYSEFAKLNRMRPAPPSQWLVFHHPRYGAVDFKHILLEPPLRERAAARVQSSRSSAALSR